ncbi:hypothetical protein [Epilithonimonas hungarica]|uniref:Uncharacterized protein n=1 Tax=Epilithonimonas hungarica TaxID=454006 RepID=A0A1G7VYX6_9FLAO|nr:hypothetical protein [Epilithonimonas hungarica]MDP9958125.1 putative membrane protein [Epilithonimonas hungarica]SDG64975.1 hypothetical protein SAMN05421825_3764 [Epilithonimonas hungarica]
MNKIKFFAEKNPVIWALIMGIISSFILIVWGISQIKQSKINAYYEDTKPILEFIKLIFYFALLFLFFTLFSFIKSRGFVFRLLNIILFCTILFAIYIQASNNLEYLDEKIYFISVKQWTENGYEPPEEEISDTFYWLIFMCLSFINVLLLNLLPINLLSKKK